MLVTGLTVHGFRSLQVDWPKDGLGWNGVVPPIVLVGGSNGSGKTSLLNLIFELASLLVDPMRPSCLDEGTAILRLDLATGPVILHASVQGVSVSGRLEAPPPRPLYFTHDPMPRDQWGPDAIGSLNHAAAPFFGDTKRFVWEKGSVQVVTQEGDLLPLAALSSGEKRILFFADLLQRWSPGSLVLVDEPELHLHEAWIARLWREICRLQRERGGQVILATQSNFLFGLGEPGSRVLLGGPRRA